MKMIKNIIEYLIAISVIPAIILTVVHVTELKDVRNVQYELLSEEEGVFNITPGTYEKLVANKRIKNYELESKYPLITQEDIERATWEINEDLKNEIFIDENGVKRIRVEVGQIILNGSESWNLGRSSAGWKTDGDTLPFFIYYSDLAFVNANYNGKTLNSLNNEVFNSDNSLIYNDIEGFSFTPNNFAALRINKNRLVTPDVNGLREYLQRNPLTVTYELADKQDRPVEVYDFSKFKLSYDKNRIRVIFDIDDSYYLWEITNDDKMIPINGQYDLGNIWTVKFYVYEIQQPMIRTLVLLIPLIVVSGVLFYMFNIIKKKGISY